ncbi:methyl-accepting chemotaxis protein [Pseudomonas sp. PDM13]|nr:PAS domain-containing methyl-accepting chemotaxis protein [Pseudomonas sp. PDM13]MCU9946339.1 methyl-accepting chemotaxis protein [Pseudomonas sp. PDM13]
MKRNLPVSGRAIAFAANANILSTTDLKGVITHVNQDFVDVSGFSRPELIGHSHNLVRHPDMPAAAFAHLWQTLKAGRSWMGLVKNRCKNGDHYWVSAFVTPVVRDGQVLEYQSVRTSPNAEQIHRAEQLYGQLEAGRTPLRLRAPQLPLHLRLLAGPALGSALGLFLYPALAPWGAFAGPASWAIALGCAGLFLHRQLRPLRDLLRHARAIADNPLSQAVYGQRSDEFGQLGFCLQMLEMETGALVGRIAESSRQLAEHAEELAAAVAHGSAGSHRQQLETDQVATAVGQMAGSVQEVARNAQQSACAADQTDDAARIGQHEVGATRARIAELDEEVRNATRVVRELQDHSSEIGQVLDVIQGVAEQTNLLALNAAIEAARAGDAGRGFAVVADEVRALAGRTQQSTAQINQMINSLQSGAEQAVAAMQRSCVQAESSLAQAQRAAESLERINQQVGAINGMSLQIASAVEQQSAASEEIQRSLATIRRAADDNAASGQCSQRSAGEVAGLAADLRQLALQFWSSRRGLG